MQTDSTHWPVALFPTVPLYLLQWYHCYFSGILILSAMQSKHWGLRHGLYADVMSYRWKVGMTQCYIHFRNRCGLQRIDLSTRKLSVPIQAIIASVRTLAVHSTCLSCSYLQHSYQEVDTGALTPFTVLGTICFTVMDVVHSKGDAFTAFHFPLLSHSRSSQRKGRRPCGLHAF